MTRTVWHGGLATALTVCAAVMWFRNEILFATGIAVVAFWHLLDAVFSRREPTDRDPD